MRRAIAVSVVVLGVILPSAGASDTTAIQAAGTLTMTGVKSNASWTPISASQTITMTGVKSNASWAAIQAAEALIMTGTR